MNQGKYLVYAFLILFAGIIAYFAITKLTNSKIANNSPNIIDYIEPSDSGSIKNYGGKNLFNANCASCHNVFKNVTGPALGGFEERGPWNDKKNIYEFIRNPEKFEQKNKYVKSLKAEYGAYHTRFENLSDVEIDAIVKYINMRYSSSPIIP
jgi:mono/diheme cytochrome c family protein